MLFSEKPKPTVNKDDEEIIAEDYDDLKKKEELMNSLKHSYENSDEGEKSEDEEMSDSELVKRKFKVSAKNLQINGCTLYLRLQHFNSHLCFFFFFFKDKLNNSLYFEFSVNFFRSS